MTWRASGIGAMVTIAFLSVYPCVGQSLLKVPMLHSHGSQFPGKGTLDVTDTQGIAWTEQQGTDYGPGGPFSMNAQAWRSVSKHSFSVTCADIRDSELDFHDGVNWIIFRLPKESYKFASTEGHSATVLLDQVRALCHLGQPALESDKERILKNLSSDGAGQPAPQDEVAFDTFFQDGGGRGVLFITRAGVIYEQVIHQPPVIKRGGKIGWKGVEKTEIARMAPLSMPCSSLTDITLRGTNMDSQFGNGHQPEVDINTGAVVYRFMLGSNIHPQSVKQAIADYCSRN